MVGSSRRRFLQVAGAGAVAATTGIAGCSSLPLAASDGAAYASLVATDSWLNESDYFDGGSLRSVRYFDVQEMSRYYDVLPQGELWKRASIYGDPAFVAASVTSTRTDGSVVWVERLRGEEAAYLERRGISDEALVDTSAFGYTGYFDPGVVVAVGDGHLMGVRYRSGAIERPPDGQEGLVDDVANLLADRPSRWFGNASSDERVSRIADVLGDQTWAEMQFDSAAPPDVVARADGLSMGDWTTKRRSVCLFDGEPKPDEFRERLQGMGAYEDVSARRTRDAVLVTGRTRTQYVDMLDSGTPVPQASFAFTAKGNGSVEVVHEEGVALDADRVRLAVRSSDSESPMPVTSQFEASMEVVSAGDSVTVTPPANAGELVVQWLRRPDLDDEEDGWGRFAVHELE